jgi:hypothetical protein
MQIVLVYLPSTDLPKVTLCLGPGLTLQALFHPQFECINKVREIEHRFMKSCRILFSLEFNLMKNMRSSQGGGKTNLKLRVKLP